MERVLEPVTGKYTDDTNFLISRSDACYNEFFGFFGLPAGDYTLTIEARGYQPLEKKVSVLPGIPNYFQSIELTPY